MSAAGTGDPLKSGNDKQSASRLIRWIMVPVGLLLAIIGVLTFWLPLPIGLPLFVLGGVILVRHSAYARQAVAAASRRYPAIRRGLKRLRRSQNGAGRGTGHDAKPASSESSD